MNMALPGGKAGSIAANLSSGINKNNIASEENNFRQRTQGSVFNDRQFGDLTFRNPHRRTSNPAKNLLTTKNFGSLTNPSQAGIMNTTQPISRNDAQDHTKTGDEMLAIANNLDMKDMWAAA